MNSKPSPTTNGAKAVKVAFSYSHKDEGLLNELHTHLSALRRQGLISTWHDRKITPGNEWAEEIDSHFEEADIILLLISADFIGSDYCHEIEMKRALERHDAGEAVVIPIFLRSCHWKGEPFGKLQALPTDAKPVESAAWHNRDDAFTVITEGVRRAIVAWQQRQAQPQRQNPMPPQKEETLPLTDMPPGNQPGAYPSPKPRNVQFNAYQAGREIVAFLERELTARMASFEAAGYVVDCHHNKDGRICFRVEADSRTVYFLDMWLGGMLGDDKALAFHHGWGHPGGSGMTATATPIPGDAGEARLDVLNFSLLKDAGSHKPYSKEEFLEAVWNEIVTTVDRSADR